MSKHNVRVVCRIRPTNSIEQKQNGVVCVKHDDTSIDISVNAEGLGFDSSSHYTFDKIFGGDSKQEDVYQDTAASLVNDVMKGYNATIFAYGQTGAGKTHTMEGDIHDEKMKGIVPRSISSIFEGIASADETIEFSIKVSFVEIYLEKIRDLLDSTHTKNNLAVREDKIKGIYIAGCNEEFVASVEELLEIMKYGATNRAKAATNMNEGSSRSHSIFTVQVTQRDTLRNSSKTGKLVLVDLAGSETVKKTNATGARLDEAITINKSLSALGQVINALTDPTSQHIPYRDSKLTRVLQDSLGGNAKTVLIIAISPSSYNANESVSTLRFGTRAKSIENKVKINQVRSVEELEILLARAEKVIASLTLQVATLRAGGKLEDIGIMPPPPGEDSDGGLRAAVAKMGGMSDSRSNNASASLAPGDPPTKEKSKKIVKMLEIAEDSDEEGLGEEEEENLLQIDTTKIDVTGDNIDALLDDFGPLSPTTKTLARANSRRLRGGSSANLPTFAELNIDKDKPLTSTSFTAKAVEANLSKIEELERVQRGLITEKSQLMQSNSELARKLIEAHNALEALSHIQDETSALEDEVEGLHKVIKEKQKEIDRLGNELHATDSSAAEHVSELTSALEVLTQQMTSCSAQMEELRVSAQQKEEMIDLLNESHEGAMTAAEKSIKVLQQELDESRAGIMAMSNDVVTLSSVREADKRTIEQLRGDLAQAAEDGKSNKKAIANLTKDLEKEWAAAAQRLETINDLNRKAVEKDRANQQLEEQLRDMQRRLEASDRSHASEIARLNDKVNSEHAHGAEQEEELHKMVEQQAINAENVKKINSLVYENNTYKAQVQNLTADLNRERLQASKKLTEIASNTHQETEGLYTQIEHLTGDLAEYKQHLQFKEGELRAVTDKLAVKERIAADATEMIAELQARNGNLMARSEKLLHEKFDIVRELENLREMMEEELTHSKHNLLDMEGNILVLEAENKHLKSLLVQLDPNFE